MRRLTFAVLAIALSTAAGAAAGWRAGEAAGQRAERRCALDARAAIEDFSAAESRVDHAVDSLRADLESDLLPLIADSFCLAAAPALTARPEFRFRADWGWLSCSDNYEPR